MQELILDACRCLEAPGVVPVIQLKKPVGSNGIIKSPGIDNQQFIQLYVAQRATYAKYYIHCYSFFTSRATQMLDYKDLSDTALAEKFRLGDDAAFREIYIRYDKLLFVFALRKLEDQDEAMDVVQDIFMWVLRNRDKFALHTSLSSYLYKCVLNKIFDIIRHQKTIRRYIDEGHHYVEVDSQEPDYLIREKQIRETIAREIAAMPPRMREVYMLKHRHYLNAQQISQQLGISEHTVLVHIQRGTKYMKDKLGLLLPFIFMMSLLLILLI